MNTAQSVFMTSGKNKMMNACHRAGLMFVLKLMFVIQTMVTPIATRTDGCTADFTTLFSLLSPKLSVSHMFDGLKIC